MIQYGCEFVGMATILSYIFDEYDKKLSNEEKYDISLEELSC